MYQGMSIPVIFGCIVLCAGMRAVLRYAEQSSGHYIAFKLLAILRDKIFKVLRQLSPAKLEVKDKGNLISIITNDIELLEVFYAHTIAPVSIAIITSAIMTLFIAQYQKLLAVIALIAYVTVGAIIPSLASKVGNPIGKAFRDQFGNMNSYILDSLRGLKETIQYNHGSVRLENMIGMVNDLSLKEKRLKRQGGIARGVTDVSILAFSFAMVFVGVQIPNITFLEIVIPTISLMSSFGPVAAISALAADLNQTAASGDRVLELLDEKPQIHEVYEGKEVDSTHVDVNEMSFKYSDELILDNLSLEIPEKSMIGIVGRSGSGKSTLLKLFMRFWDVTKGSINISGHNIKDVRTGSLRDLQSYVTQETVLFHDSIENNIRIARLNATDEEVVEAAKKASLHEFIMEFPDGYKTNVGELGDRLSGGEIQRIGLARAFLHDSPLILLDEPTSNLDSLNEAIILKSILAERENKTVILVSHRASTIKAVDHIFKVENGRLS